MVVIVLPIKSITTPITLKKIGLPNEKFDSQFQGNNEQIGQIGSL